MSEAAKPSTFDARGQTSTLDAPATPVATLDEVIEHHVRAVLRAHGNNVVQAAKALGISRWALTRRIAKHKSVVV